MENVKLVKSHNDCVSSPFDNYSLIGVNESMGYDVSIVSLTFRMRNMESQADGYVTPVMGVFRPW